MTSENYVMPITINYVNSFFFRFSFFIEIDYPDVCGREHHLGNTGGKSVAEIYENQFAEKHAGNARATKSITVKKLILQLPNRNKFVVNKRHALS